MDTFELEWKEPFDVRDLICYVDPRGILFEILRFKDARIPGQGQLYTFSIESHQRRGDHYHLNKREWFTCVHGEAIVLLSDSNGAKTAVRISPKNPKIVYAGPGTAHANNTIRTTRTHICVSHSRDMVWPMNENDRDRYSICLATK